MASQRLRPRVGGAAAGVIRRLRRPSAVLALAITAVPFGGLDGFQARVLDGRVTKTVPLGRFVVSHVDDVDRVSYTIGHLKQHPPTGPVVYLLGGSSMRECIPTPRGLSDAIQARCGVRARVRMLAANEQSPAGSLAIIDNLPTGGGGVIVIGVHNKTFLCSPSDARRQLAGIDYLMKSPALRAFVADRTGTATSNNIRPGLRHYLSRYEYKRGVPAFRGPYLDVPPHRYHQRGVLSASAKRAIVRYFRAHRGAPGGPFDANFEHSASLLEQCVKLARAKGFEVLIMENPQDHAMVGSSFDRYKDRYRPVCAQLADTYGATFVNLNETAGLRSRDFRDLYHLVSSGRLKWRPRLADQLAMLLAGVPSPSPATSPTPSPAPSLTGLLDRLTREARLQAASDGGS